MADVERMTELQCKKAAYSRRSKQGQATMYEHRNIAQAHRGGVRKAKPQLEFKRVGNIKRNSNKFCHYTNSKRLDKENAVWCQNVVGDLLTVNTNKAKVLHFLFCIRLHQHSLQA